MNQSNDRCASETKWTNWTSINWKKVGRGAKSLQRRIAKAIKEKHFHKAKALSHLLIKSFFGKLTAILKVTTNNGSKTSGVDRILWNTHTKKWKAIEQLKLKKYKAKPLKRRSIKKKNGKMRHLGIPTMRDRAVQALFKLALEPIAEVQADPNSYGVQTKTLLCRCHRPMPQRTFNA